MSGAISPTKPLTSLYGYAPSTIASGVFIAVFSLLTLTHLALVWKSKKAWLLVIVLGGALEAIGFGGRVMSHKNPEAINPFLIQIICLILAPCFFSAFIYLEATMLINALGASYSKLRPNLYMITFCICDLIAIAVQAGGGGMAAIALKKGNYSSTGTRIMVGGIAFQLVAMVVFCYLLLDFFVKARKGFQYASRTYTDQGRIKKLIRGLFLASAFILLRCIYRTIELGQGWTGYLITHEIFFILLDSVPMVFTMAALIYAHPYFCLVGSDQSATTSKQEEFEESSISSEKVSTIR